MDTQDPAGEEPTSREQRKPADLKERARQFAIRVLLLVKALPDNRIGDILGRQLARSATSVGANYRAACRARSGSEFRAKLGIVEEEADETDFWLDMIGSVDLVHANRLNLLREEANEIVAMVVASIRTSKRNEGVEV